MPIGPIARLACSICCFLYPAYASYKSLSLPATSADGDQGVERWLMYWAVVGTWTAVESTVGWFFTWIPFYSLFKLIVFLYLSLPQTQGSTVVYQRVLAPTFAEHERDIDAALGNLRSQSTSAMSDGIGYAWNKIASQLNLAGPAPAPAYRVTPPDQAHPQGQGHEQYATPVAPPPSFQDPYGGAAQKIYGMLGHYAGQYLPAAATAIQAAAAAASQNTIPRSQAQQQARQVQETLSMPIPQPTGSGGSRTMNYASASFGDTSAWSTLSGNLRPRNVSGTSSSSQPASAPGLHQQDSSESIQSRSSRSSLSGFASGTGTGGNGSGQGQGHGFGGDMSSYESISHDEVSGTSGFEVPAGGNQAGTPRPGGDKRRTSWFGRVSGTPDKERKTE